MQSQRSAFFHFYAKHFPYKIRLSRLPSLTSAPLARVSILSPYRYSRSRFSLSFRSPPIFIFRSLPVALCLSLSVVPSRPALPSSMSPFALSSSSSSRFTLFVPSLILSWDARYRADRSPRFHLWTPDGRSVGGGREVFRARGAKWNRSRERYLRSVDKFIPSRERRDTGMHLYHAGSARYAARISRHRVKNCRWMCLPGTRPLPSYDLGSSPLLV